MYDFNDFYVCVVPKSEPNITNTENEIENSPPKAKKPKAPRDPNSEY